VAERGTVTAAPGRPVLVFDGTCGFCRGWITRWQATTGDRLEYLPYQDPAVAARFPDLPRAQFEQVVVLIEPDGRVWAGAAAVFRALAPGPGRGLLWWAYRRVPGFSATAEAVYRFVASHRTIWSALTPRPRSFVATRWWFLRLLGLVYLCAFVSAWVQAAGLIGSHGISPAADLMELARRHFGGVDFLQFPTLGWFGAGDGALQVLCGAGTLLALLVIADVATGSALTGLWLLYLSLCTVGGTFFQFQWDALLLEAGLLAALFRPGSRAVRWVLRWLLFRLMLAAGVVKLSSGDPLWHNLTALAVHYETQPLPTWIGWWAHQLPLGLQKLTCATALAIELGAPLLMLGPRRARFAGGAATVGLMILIALTGNYCFFNLLTVALCVVLLDDDALPRWARQLGQTGWWPWPWRRRPAPGRSWDRWLVAAIAAYLAVLSLPPLVGSFRMPVAWPAWMHAFGAWRSVNGYGLFAVMTNPRYEIVIEGSRDGGHWIPYEFRDKPGDPQRRPGFVAPHQPRLDWQMWFAALGRYQDNPWFLNLCVRLLQGEPSVVGLLAANPFPDHPPRLIRAQYYEYHFTDRATRRATGAWWRRELRGPYLPVISLSEPGPEGG
jgi:lipase maturation factor 1